MIFYKWREEYSETFGKIYRPVAEVFVKDSNKNWRPLTIYIDSGADTSVLQRGFGELYGHETKRGIRIRMKGFGENQIIAYLHTFEFKIGKHEVKAKVAIAENDQVPNVLGRKDVFDLFEVQFKNIEKGTQFVRRKK